jgi:glyoxylase-like metal-dependent hydrolase (beta-lactamase superfamily II)
MDDVNPIGVDRRTTAGVGIEDVHRIEFDVDWPPGHVAAYLLDTPEPTLIDTGMTGERAGDRLEGVLTAAGYDLANVAHLVLTHPHVDHVGQVPTVIERADPTVYAPVGVRERLGRDPDDLARQVEANATAAGLEGTERDRAIGMARDSLERSRRLLPPAAVDRWVGEDENDAITIGDVAFETIPTPGHQADHRCFETTIEGERVLFAGDTVLAPFRPVLLHVGLDRGVREGLPAFERTLDRSGLPGPRPGTRGVRGDDRSRSPEPAPTRRGSSEPARSRERDDRGRTRPRARRGRTGVRLPAPGGRLGTRPLGGDRSGPALDHRGRRPALSPGVDGVGEAFRSFRPVPSPAPDALDDTETTPLATDPRSPRSTTVIGY